MESRKKYGIKGNHLPALTVVSPRGEYFALDSQAAWDNEEVFERQLRQFLNSFIDGSLQSTEDETAKAVNFDNYDVLGQLKQTKPIRRQDLHRLAASKA
jgi:hypothetical protein